MKHRSILACALFISLLALYASPVVAQPGTAPLAGTNVVSSSDAASPVSNSTGVASTAVSTTNPPVPPTFPSCGFHTQNTSQIVATSTGSSVVVTIGEPSWLQLCNSVENSGISLVGYEIFPVTIHAAPDTTFTLENVTMSTPPQKVAVGSANGTAWSWPNPAVVTTNSDGIAQSNLTLIGAVMPFVPNDISNFSLPVTAQSSNGLVATAELPIEITGTGMNRPDMLSSPGQIDFTRTINATAGNPAQFLQIVGYIPSPADAAPLQVSLSIAGSWEDGKVGPLPTAVQVSLANSTFEVGPRQVFCLWVDVTNSFNSSTYTGTNTYTLAVQESVGNATYLEPLSVSIASSVSGITFATGTASNGQSGTGPSVSPSHSGPRGQEWPQLVPLAAVIISAVLIGILVVKRRKTSQDTDQSGSLTSTPA